MTANDVLTGFAQTYPDCPQAVALQLLTQAWAVICREVPYVRDRRLVAMTAGTQFHTVDQSGASLNTVLRIWRAEVVATPTTAREIGLTTVDQLNVDRPGWRYEANAEPRSLFAIGDQARQSVWLSPTPSASTVLVIGATNATPIVATTSAAHGLAVGATVRIEGVAGNTAANGLWTIDQVPSATQLRLQGSAGNGAFSGSGVLSGAGPGYLALEVSTLREFTATSDDLPDSPMLAQMIRHQMAAIYARDLRQHADADAFEMAARRLIVAESGDIKTRVAGSGLRVSTARYRHWRTR